MGHAAGVGERDIGGQILVLAAERVGHPRAEGGEAVQHEAGREKILRRAVGVRLARERMHEGQVVGQFREMRDQVADHFSRTAAGAKRILWSREIPRGTLKGHGGSARQRLTVPFDQLRLVVPGFQLADRSGAENYDDVLRLRREMRQPRCVGPCQVDRRRGEQAIATQHAGEGDRAERGRGVREELAAVEQRVRREAIHGKKRNSLLLKSARPSGARPCARTMGSASRSSSAVGVRENASS